MDSRFPVTNRLSRIANLFRHRHEVPDLEKHAKRRIEEGLLDLEVEVTEQSTGQFQAGVGFSSVETVVFTTSVTERNLFGRGQVATVSARLGGLSQDFVLSFQEPWLFGRPISAGVSVFRRSVDFFTFDSLRTGFSLSLGRTFGEFNQGTLTYSYEILEISDGRARDRDDRRHRSAPPV